VPACPAHNRDASALGEVQRARQHICCCRSDDRDDDDRNGELLGEVEHRQAKDIKADVAAENRIGNTERDTVTELQPAHPFAARREADHERDDKAA
jgi:hypothetical protein